MSSVIVLTESAVIRASTGVPRPICDPDELADGEALEEEVAEIAAVAAGEHEPAAADVDEAVEHLRLAVDADLLVARRRHRNATDREDVGRAVGEDRHVDRVDRPLGQADRVVVGCPTQLDDRVTVGLDGVQAGGVVVDHFDVETPGLGPQVRHGTVAVTVEVRRVVGEQAWELDEDDLILFLDVVVLGDDADPYRDEPVARAERDRAGSTSKRVSSAVQVRQVDGLLGLRREHHAQHDGLAGSNLLGERHEDDVVDAGVGGAAGRPTSRSTPSRRSSDPACQCSDRARRCTRPGCRCHGPGPRRCAP